MREINDCHLDEGGHNRMVSISMLTPIYLSQMVHAIAVAVAA